MVVQPTKLMFYLAVNHKQVLETLKIKGRCLKFTKNHRQQITRSRKFKSLNLTFFQETKTKLSKVPSLQQPLIPSISTRWVEISRISKSQQVPNKSLRKLKVSFSRENSVPRGFSTQNQPLIRRNQAPSTQIQVDPQLRSQRPLYIRRPLLSQQLLLILTKMTLNLL